MRLQRGGSGDSPGLSLRSDLREVGRADRWLVKLGAARHLPEDVLYDVRLAVDEVLSNIIRHGYGEGAPGEIRLAFEADNGTIRVTVRDQARPFDPLAVPDPKLSPNIEERDRGGLGIYLVRKVMDRVTYERSGDGNLLKLERSLSRRGRSAP